MLKAMVLVLVGEKNKSKLLAAWSTAFRVFWGLCSGLLFLVKSEQGRRHKQGYLLLEVE